MRVVFRKDKTKKYVCTICDKQFNWNNGCWWYGRDESPEGYEEKPNATLCSDTCKNIYVKQLA